jgi:hypothetical protein
MKSAAFTIKAFGAYVVLTGVALMLAPNLLLGPLGFAETKEIWIRVVGVLAAILGYYYWVCGTADAKAFFAASIYGRMFFCAACVALVVLAGAPWMLILFGVVDVAGAAWTSMALRKERAG